MVYIVSFKTVRLHREPLSQKKEEGEEEKEKENICVIYALLGI